MENLHKERTTSMHYKNRSDVLDTLVEDNAPAYPMRQYKWYMRIRKGLCPS